MPALAFTATSAVAFIATRSHILHETPREVMTHIESRVRQAGGGANTCVHRRDPTPTVGRIRRPNPDILPTTMAYDVSQSAVRLTGVTTSPRYWSLSVFQHNSDNIFVLNDRDLRSPSFDVVIFAAGRQVQEREGAIMIESPSDTGIVLIRRFLPDEDEIEPILANQNAMICDLLPYKLK